MIKVQICTARYWHGTVQMCMQNNIRSIIKNSTLQIRHRLETMITEYSHFDESFVCYCDAQIQMKQFHFIDLMQTYPHLILHIKHAYHTHTQASLIDRIE